MVAFRSVEDRPELIKMETSLWMPQERSDVLLVRDDSNHQSPMLAAEETEDLLAVQDKQHRETRQESCVV